MSLIKLRHASLTALLLVPLWACNDDGNDSGDDAASTETDGSGPEESAEGNTENNGDGDGDNGDGDGEGGDGDGDGDEGDGDGDGDEGDGDGDEGDGDGDGESGDGDGEEGDGDGDGESGDGDGDGDVCPPDDAHGQGMCDQFFGWAWNGVECVGVSGCNCVGTDCGNIPIELGDCEAAHADCGMGDACADLGLEACQNSQGCMPINGAKLEGGNLNQCLEEPAFIECSEQLFCAEVLTWGCDINATKYLFFNSCLPQGFMPCNGPNGDPPPC